MAAWLERDVNGRAASFFASGTECLDLRMRSAEALVPAFADDDAIANIGFGSTAPSPRRASAIARSMWRLSSSAAFMTGG
jgi:hypothetical protein